jgi:hypothetical protein
MSLLISNLLYYNNSKWQRSLEEVGLQTSGKRKV